MTIHILLTPVSYSILSSSIPFLLDPNLCHKIELIELYESKKIKKASNISWWSKLYFVLHKNVTGGYLSPRIVVVVSLACLKTIIVDHLTNSYTGDTTDDVSSEAYFN
jgi:hypothetical protein